MHRHKVLFEEQTSRGNGDGTAQPHVDYAAGYYRPPPPNSRFLCVVMGDLNDDRKLDLAVANDEDRTVSVLLGNGDGTFQEAVNYLAGTNPQALAVGDFNRDGRLDLAVANYSFSGPATVSVLLAKGTSVAPSVNGLTFSTQLLGAPSAAQSIITVTTKAVPLSRYPVSPSQVPSRRTFLRATIVGPHWRQQRVAQLT